MAKMDNTREWRQGEDGKRDRVAPERPVSERHWKGDSGRFDAVPGATTRPGSRN